MRWGDTMKNKKSLLLLTLLPFIFGFTNIAHRGDNELGKYTEHTYQAYDRALAEQTDYLELDLEQTKDGVLVINHDGTLTRLFGQRLKISDLTYSQLQRYYNQAGEPVHSLEEIFQRYSGDPKIKFMIETRGVGMEDQLVSLINRYGLQNRVLFESFTPASLARLAVLAPSIPRTQLGGEYYNVGNNQYYASYRYDPLAASYLKQNGKKYLLWGVNDASAMKQIIDSGNVDGLITDFPGRLSQILGVKNYPARTINGYIVIKYRPHYSVNVWHGYGTSARFAHRRLADGSRVRVYQVAIQNNKTWYNIGGNQWIDGQYAASYPIKAIGDEVEVKQSGVIRINYRGGSVNLWQEPGDHGFTGRRLKNGTSWKFFATKILNGRVYYNLGGNQWIDGQYAVQIR